MDNITGKPSNSIESGSYDNITVKSINSKSVNNEIQEQDELQLKVLTLENTINHLIEFINITFNKNIESV
jgi:hypothetical protein